MLALTILIDGVVYASWLFIVALGLTLVFGVLKILNIAHGSFYAVGAYAAASFVGWFATLELAPAWSPVAMLLAAVAVAAVLASVNARSALVHRRPRVAVLSTGDELVDDGSALAPGQIRESNRTMLVGLVNASGVEAIDYGIVRDDEAALETVLRDAANSCDAIVTSGGVSMGDYDVVKAVLSRIADMRWMQIAIKPAKPFAFGRLANGRGTPVPVFGLPGNPVSSLVSFELLARPALRRMAGHPESAWNRPMVNAVADQPLSRGRDGKVHYQRVVARFADDGRVHVQSVRAQASHQLAATALANAIAVVGDGDGVPVGGEVPVILLVT